MEKRISRSDKEIIEILLYSKLPNLTSPNFQRIIDQERVDKIVNGIRNCKVEIIPSMLVVCRSKDRDTHYICDGAHRYCAYKRLYEEDKRDIEVIVNFIEIDNYEEAEKIFRIVNDVKCLPEMPLAIGLNLNLASKISYDLQMKYYHLFPKVKRITRPFLSENLITEKLLELESKGVKLNYDEFWIKLDKLNDDIEKNSKKYKDKGDQKSFEKYRAEIKVKIGPVGPYLYVGIMKENGWLDHIYNTKENRREKLTELLKNRIYERDKHCCRLCTRELHKDDVQYAHIISFENGGEAKEDNLVVSCQKCNTSLGKKNITDYFKEQNKEWKL